MSRDLILDHLCDGGDDIKGIAVDTGLHRADVCKALLAMRDEGLVQCAIVNGPRNTTGASHKTRIWSLARTRKAA